jgi:hypothetical protein
MTNERREPESSLLALLEQRYGIAPATLQRIGALIAMWGTFEFDLEQALWRLSGETPHGEVPTTDTMPVSRRIERFRQLANELEGEAWHELVKLIGDVAENLAAYRNAIVHGRLLPASVGGGLVLNSRWYGELRKRPSMIAHVDENLVGIMLDGLHELLKAMAQIAHGDGAPNLNPRILAQRQKLRSARSGTGEVRYLTELMNSEKY